MNAIHPKCGRLENVTIIHYDSGSVGLFLTMLVVKPVYTVHRKILNDVLHVITTVPLLRRSVDYKKKMKIKYKPTWVYKLNV